MKTLSVGEFKAHFSKVLQDVQNGRQVGVSFGRKGEIVAVLVSPKDLVSSTGLKLGLLEGKARFRTRADYKMTDDEVFSS